MEVAPPPQRRGRGAKAPEAPEEGAPSALAAEGGEVGIEEGSESAPEEMEG